MVECISDETLSAYVDDRLNAEERSAVESHLARCSRCFEHLVLLKRVVDARESFADLQIPEHVLAKARGLIEERCRRPKSILELVVRLQKDLVSLVQTTGELLLPTPEPVPVRGHRRSDRSMLAHTIVEDTDVTVEVESRSGRPVLRVMLKEVETGRPPSATRVDLSGPGGPETRFSEQGLADFGERKPGHYVLRIEDIGDVEVGITR
jgi:anti-sigma factor RsiW